jgi:hypothetical protein
MSGAYDHILIRVQSDWKSPRGAMVRLGDLREVHWDQTGDAPRRLVHGYIACSQIVTGYLPHACCDESAPHRLRVCVLKRHNLPMVYEELTRRAIS